MNSRKRQFGLLVAVFVSVCLGWIPMCGAHTARMTSALAHVSANGDVEITVTLDVISYALNDTSQRVADEAMDALLDGPVGELKAGLADAADRLEHGTHIAGGTIQSIAFPTVEEVQGYLKKNPQPRLPVIMTVRMEGHVPASATTFSMKFPEVLGTVVLTIERPGEEPAAVAMDPDRWSEPVGIHLTGAATQPSGQAATAESAEGGAIPFFHTLGEFVVLGFKHIVPEGLDHILFVLGLFLLSTKVKPLLFQVTAFTVAHSITLGLSMYGIFRLPSSVVEPLIALSITFVAVENVFTNKLHFWRPFVVFGFGLVHGLGFSAALTDLHLLRSQFVPALVGFNSGVELGQLSVIGLAFAGVGWFRSERWYRPAIAVPASVVIAATGLFWTVQRVFWT